MPGIQVLPARQDYSRIGLGSDWLIQCLGESYGEAQKVPRGETRPNTRPPVTVKANGGRRMFVGWPPRPGQSPLGPGRCCVPYQPASRNASGLGSNTGATPHHRHRKKGPLNRDCGSGCRGFKSHQPPLKVSWWTRLPRRTLQWPQVPLQRHLGRFIAATSLSLVGHLAAVPPDGLHGPASSCNGELTAPVQPFSMSGSFLMASAT